MVHCPEGKVIAPDTLFTEEDVLKTTRKWKWISVSAGGHKLLAMNWVVSLISTIVLLGFVIASAAAPEEMTRVFRSEGQPWVTQNFTWLYIITQDYWVCFLIFLCFTRYGSLKLGKENEVPRFNDMTWFCMLFCCGIAVGFFLFGAGEPLYYYRQNNKWYGWSYNLRKIQVNDDDQRATQSLFMCFFHWGVHGWIPYILMAVNAGVVSHKWGLPLTIRACFYPLIGDTVYSLIGDLIDSISMACTTFGVCTSLGLGVTQLAMAMQYMEKEFRGTSELQFTTDGYVGFIWIITATATLSVVLGLGRGLWFMSLLAMCLCLFLLLFCLFADNTSYLLNVMVQTTGYYIQYVIQAGFDCEAFQQLAFEFDSSKANLLWGSGPQDLIHKIGNKMGADVAALNSEDCGSQVNACVSGVIMTHFFSSAEMGGRALSSMGVTTFAAGASFLASYPTATGVPCGTYDTAAEIGAAAGLPIGTPASMNVLPGCPITTFDATATWGTCAEHAESCSKFQGLFDSTNRYFMDWWTIFYWGWWVSWGPFVGIFIASISRGRTIRSVIMGAFILPCIFSFSWFSVFGGLAIKMERVAEFALNVKPDYLHGTIDCSAHYTGGVPHTPEAIALLDLGYTMLPCQPYETQIYDLMKPYKNYAPFLYVMLWVALFFWFVTSSDSGSYVDDLLAAGGLSHPPPLQKIYWGFTEGAVASAIVGSAPSGSFTDVLKGLRSVSICAGLPLTVLMCLMVPATYRALKREFGDADIINSKKFNTQLFDFCEGFKPKNANLPYWGKGGMIMTKVAIALFVPGFGVYKALSVTSNHKLGRYIVAGLCQLCWLAFFVFQILQAGPAQSFAFSWVMYCFMIAAVAYTRAQLRERYNIWGNLVEDMWVSLTMYPFVVSQVELQAENDGAGSPNYFHDLDVLLGSEAGITMTKTIETAGA